MNFLSTLTRLEAVQWLCVNWKSGSQSLEAAHLKLCGQSIWTIGLSICPFSFKPRLCSASRRADVCMCMLNGADWFWNTIWKCFGVLGWADIVDTIWSIDHRNPINGVPYSPKTGISRNRMMRTRFAEFGNPISMRTWVVMTWSVLLETIDGGH